MDHDRELDRNADPPSVGLHTNASTGEASPEFCIPPAPWLLGLDESEQGPESSGTFLDEPGEQVHGQRGGGTGATEYAPSGRPSRMPSPRTGRVASRR